VLVEDIVRAQCYTEVWRDEDGWCREIPYVRGERHGIARRWRADGSRECEIPYVDGKAHGKVTWWLADGTVWRTQEIPYVNGAQHGTVDLVEEWVHGVRRK